MIAQNRGGSERRTPNVGGMAPSRISVGSWPLQQVLDQGWFSPVGASSARRYGSSHGTVPLIKGEQGYRRTTTASDRRGESGAQERT